jgi:hypothetical protein
MTKNTITPHPCTNKTAPVHKISYQKTTPVYDSHDQLLRHSSLGGAASGTMPTVNADALNACISTSVYSSTGSSHGSVESCLASAFCVFCAVSAEEACAEDWKGLTALNGDAVLVLCCVVATVFPNGFGAASWFFCCAAAANGLAEVVVATVPAGCCDAAGAPNGFTAVEVTAAGCADWAC